MSAMTPEFASQMANAAGMVVRFPVFRKALTMAQHCIERSAYRQPPPGLLIVGPSGSGKTTLAKQLMGLYPPSETPERSLLPILYVQTPSEPTIKSLAEAILLALGVDIPARFTAEQLTRLIVKWLKARGVRLIVFDEVQHFAERKHERVRVAADYFKMLINVAGLPIILLGLESSERLLDVNEQLRRRFTSRVRLGRFRYRTPKEQATFQGFLRAIQAGGKLQLELDLEDLKNCLAFYWATGGLPAHVMNLFLGAAEVAFREGRSLLTRTDFATAFVHQVWEEGYGNLNPFSSDFVGRELSFPGEPFAYLVGDEPQRRAA